MRPCVWSFSSITSARQVGSTTWPQWWMEAYPGSRGRVQRNLSGIHQFKKMVRNGTAQSWMKMRPRSNHTARKRPKITHFMEKVPTTTYLQDLFVMKWNSGGSGRMMTMWLFWQHFPTLLDSPFWSPGSISPVTSSPWKLTTIGRSSLLRGKWLTCWSGVWARSIVEWSSRAMRLTTPMSNSYQYSVQIWNPRRPRHPAKWISMRNIRATFLRSTVPRQVQRC